MTFETERASIIKRLGDKEKIYILLFCEAVIIFLVHVFNIGRLYGFYLTEDELGYWGNAAFLLGKDWGNTVRSCSYYSFGYSFFLMAILSLPVKALTTYRLAIAANALFMVLSFFISYYLFTCLSPNRSKASVSIACMAMALYSSYVTQSSVAWTECYLVLFAWLILLQGYLVCKRATIIKILIFAVEVGYIYMIHQRTVPFLIAGVLFIIILTVRKKATIRQLIVGGVTMVVMLCLAFALKNYIKSGIYRSGAIANEYSSILRGIELSSFLIPVIREAAGQLYYLWASSFGIIPLGIGATVAACVKKWKERDEVSYFYGFVLLAFLGLLGVSSIFMRLGAYRIDYWIYGRYIETIAGYFIIMGLLEISDLVKRKKSWLIFGASCVGFVGLALMLLNKILSRNFAPERYIYHGVCAPGMFWLHSLYGFSLLKWGATVLVVEAIIFISAKFLFKKRWMFIAETLLITVIWIAAGQTVIKKQICTYQEWWNRDLALQDDLWEYIEEHADSAVFLTNIRCSNRGNIQLYMGEPPLYVISDLKTLDFLPDILIVDNDESVIDGDILKNYYLCYLGRQNIYSLNEPSVDNLGELDSTMFIYRDLGTEESNHVMYGPYVHLEPGTYEVTFQMNTSTDGQEILGRMDVSSDKGNNIICSTDWDGTSQTVTMRFHLDERASDTEFRYFKHAGNDTIPLKVTLNVVRD